MARLQTRGGFRGLEFLLAVLAVVGLVILLTGLAHKELVTLIQGGSLLIVAIVLIVVVERRARRHPR